VVANIEAKDGGKAIAAGNARVLSARLNDARYFWDVDRRTPLYTEERVAKLKQIVFHQKLGSVWDKVERVKSLAVELCAVTGADPALVERAALLCKMDLVTETVGEFPELQGQVGRQLYLAETAARLPLDGGGARAAGGGGARSATRGEPREARSSSSRPSPPQSSLRDDSSPIEGERALSSADVESVAAAIEDHYRPLGPNDRVPSDPVAVTLALADKLDTLVGFWAINEKPTGSSDAYGLRRAALGDIRALADNVIRLSQSSVIQHHAMQRFKDVIAWDHWTATAKIYFGRVEGDTVEYKPGTADPFKALTVDLMRFLADRLKVQLREHGKRHDLVDAVFALGDDDLVRIVARVEALDVFLKTEDGANLLAGYKRAANILTAEEKKGKGLTEADAAKGLVPTLLVEPAEIALNVALEKALPAARAAVEKEDFAAAMKALSALRAPVDAFFDHVLVNAEDANIRRNRLLLLSRFREALSAVADFAKIEG
jgi:glycyl-tRNA synthetase beta chain